jgi:hypothetical protein
MGQGQLGYIKTNTLFDITKLMLKRIMSENAVSTRFPQGTPMGGSRSRAQFTTSPDRFGPFAESMCLLLCAVGANSSQWDALISTLAAKRQIEFNEVRNRDIIVEKRLFLDEIE